MLFRSSSKPISSQRKSTGSSRGSGFCTTSGSRRMRPSGARMTRKTAIPWWSGASPRPRPSKSAMTGASIGAGFTKYTAAVPAGVVRFKELMNCASCAAITRSCGRGCGPWMSGRGPCMAPAPWGSSKRTGAWRGWRNVLPERRRKAREAHPPPSDCAALERYIAQNQTARR